MAKLTKRMRVIREKVDVTKEYEINEAVALLQELATAKFVESVDVAVNLGIDARKSDQNVRGATVLPHGTGTAKSALQCSLKVQTLKQLKKLAQTSLVWKILLSKLRKAK